MSRRGFGRRVVGLGAGAAGLTLADSLLSPADAAATTPAWTVDVRDYGAALDGVTDDAPAIQAAINAASQRGGGVVVIPAAQAPAASSGLNGSSVLLRSTIRLASGVWLRGLGPATVLASTADPVIGLPTSGQAADRMTLSDLLIQSPPGVGVALDAAGQSGGYQLGWPRVVVQDVTVTDAGSHGFLNAYSAVIEARWVNCVSLRARGAGFNIQATDTMLTNCTAAASPGSNTIWGGFQIGGANNKLVGCKSYGNAAVHGFVLANGGRHVLVGCEAQDNGLAGFQIGGGGAAGSTVTGCLSESNGTAGFILDGPYSRVSGAFAHKVGGGSGQTTPVGFMLTPQAVRCSVEGDTDCATPVGGSGRGCDVKVGVTGRQVLRYAPSVTPDPYAGDIVAITLAGNLYIADPIVRHEGQRLTLELTQDAVGRRVVTFSPRFRASWSPVILARTTNSITFEFDGLYWVQVASAVGVTASATPRISDGFARADGSVGNAEIGGKWLVSGQGRPVVSQGRFGVFSATAGASGAAVIDAHVSDARLTVIWSVVNCGALIFRWQDANNYWAVSPAGVFKWVGGKVTMVQQGIGVINNGDQVSVQCVGSTITVSCNGLEIATITDGALQTATKFGLAALALGSSTSADYFDNFLVV